MDLQKIVYSYVFQFQSPSKYSQFDAIRLSRCLFHHSKQFLDLNSSILMPFSAFAVFCFTSSTLAKCFPLRTVIFWGNNKSHMRHDPVNREGGAWGSRCFWSKTAQHRCACKSSIVKWASALKEFFKKLNFAEPNTACHNNASWYTDPDGFPEHSPSEGSLSYKGPALQSIILAFWGFPLYMDRCTCLFFNMLFFATFLTFTI